MQSEKICVTFPIGLRARAHANGINVSAVAAKAVTRTVQAIENETGVIAAKQTSPATTPEAQGAS